MEATARLHVLARPRNDLLHRIDMRRLGPRGTRRKRRAARIGEEVQHARREAVGPQRRAAVADEVPVRSLLGEKTDVLERGEAETHPKHRAAAVVAYRPALRHPGPQAPLPALLAAGVAQKRSVGHAPPLLLGQAPPPDRLRLRTARYIRPEAFELLEIARVDEFVIGKTGCKLFLHGFP